MVTGTGSSVPSARGLAPVSQALFARGHCSLSPSSCPRPLSPILQNGDWDEFRSFCEISCLYPILPPHPILRTALSC